MAKMPKILIKSIYGDDAQAGSITKQLLQECEVFKLGNVPSDKEGVLLNVSQGWRQGYEDWKNFKGEMGRITPLRVSRRLKKIHRAARELHKLLQQVQEPGNKVDGQDDLGIVRTRNELFQQIAIERDVLESQEVSKQSFNQLQQAVTGELGGPLRVMAGITAHVSCIRKLAYSAAYRAGPNNREKIFQTGDKPHTAYLVQVIASFWQNTLQRKLVRVGKTKKDEPLYDFTRALLEVFETLDGGKVIERDYEGLLYLFDQHVDQFPKPSKRRNRSKQAK